MVRMKKFLLALMIAGSIAAPTSAQEVTVEGFGIDRDSATRDAIHAAVEQVAGTYIESQTQMRDLMISLDEVYKKSRGYVKSINILSEQKVGANYRVKARVDVDTDPNGKLMSDLAMIIRLNDPRIAVIVMNGNVNQSNNNLNQSGNNLFVNGEYSQAINVPNVGNTNAIKYDRTAETALSNKLEELGFSNVSDTDIIIRRSNARLLNDIYQGNAPLSNAVENDNAIDYLIIGQSNSYVSALKVPDFNSGSLIESGMKIARAQLTVKVIKYDTGNLVGTFQVEGQASNAVDQTASEFAIKDAAAKAADELSRSLRRVGSKPTESLQWIVRADSYDKVIRFRQELLELNGVQNVYLREYAGGKAVINVESVQRPNVLLQYLMQRTQFGITVDSVANSLIELTIT